MNYYKQTINDVANSASDYSEDLMDTLLSRWESIVDDEEEMLFI
jgi:hypothetical protein